MSAINARRWTAKLRPWGELERPANGEVFSSWLDVKGWALFRRASGLRVVVSANGRPLRELTSSLPRPDVALAYPHLPDAGRCGFRTRLMRQELPPDPLLHLRVAVYPPGLLSAHRMMTWGISVRRHDDSLIGHVRGAYPDVWNAEATNAAAARCAVCGTTDVSEWGRSGADTALDVIRETGITGADVVLEIGCGSGRVGRHVAPHCARWIGCDVSRKMLDHAREDLVDMSNVSFQELNGYDLADIESGSIDVVYCTAVLMHLDEWDRFRYFQEAGRILKPGGRAYFDSSNLLGEQGWSMFAELVELDPAMRPANISKMSTPDELVTYASRAGFVDIRMKSGPLFVTVMCRAPE